MFFNIAHININGNLVKGFCDSKFWSEVDSIVNKLTISLLYATNSPTLTASPGPSSAIEDSIEDCTMSSGPLGTSPDFHHVAPDTLQQWCRMDRNLCLRISISLRKVKILEMTLNNLTTVLFPTT
jgi:hypothetical protein